MDWPNSSGILQSFEGAVYGWWHWKEAQPSVVGRGRVWGLRLVQIVGLSLHTTIRLTHATWLCNAHADCRLSLSVSVSTSDPWITCSHQGGILARVSSVVVERSSQLLRACCLSLNASSLAGDFCVEEFYLTEVDVVGQQVWETQKRYWYGDMEQIAIDCSFQVGADRNSLSKFILFDLVAKSN